MRSSVLYVCGVIGSSMLCHAQPVLNEARIVYERAGTRALELDATRLAIATPVEHGFSGRGVDVGPMLEAAGLAVASVEAHAITGWSLASVEGRMTHAELRDRLDDLASVGVFASPVFIGLDGGPVFASQTLLVGTDGLQGRIETVDLASGVVLARDWAGLAGAYKIESDARHGLELIERASELRDAPGVLWAEPDMIFTGRSSLDPNDPLFGEQWAFENAGSPGLAGFDVNAREAWELARGSAEVPVLVIDTGVDPLHPDLLLLPGVDTTSDDGNGGPVNNNDRHGTAVAGCVSAITDNGIGIAGLAPESPTMSARAFISINSGGNWTSSASWSVEALAAGEAAGVRVTNNSNFYGFTSAAFEAKLTQTRADSMVHFASAGNGTAFGSTYPAALPMVNSVAASDRFGQLASFSNFGPSIFITAPGASVLSTDIRGSGGYSGSDYATVSGTSFASPYVSAVAALVLSVDPTLSAADVERILASTAVLPDVDDGFGAGFVDARAAVSLALAERCPADVNADGELNGLDFGAWLGAFNSSSQLADQNGDGKVSGLDFGAWLAGYNAGCD